MNIITLK